MGSDNLKYLTQFLNDYPGMSTSPCLDAGLHLCGIFRFKAKVSGGEEIEDAYKLDIYVPSMYPQDIPIVKEIGKRIPRNGDFHINHDASLCLGSPLRLLIKIHDTPNLCDFAAKCLVPYLYAVTHKLRYGGNFLFGELVHGGQGILNDYSDIFCLHDQDKIKHAYESLCVKKRIANKRPCPCGCGKRLGNCSFHHTMNDFRKMASVAWYKKMHIFK